MKFNTLIPELTVSSLEQSRHFYVDQLGFEAVYERKEDAFLFVALEDIQLMLQEDNEEWTTGSLTYPYGRGINFEMKVADVDRLYARVTKAGIMPFRPLTENEYRIKDEFVKQREFLIQDPDGYLLRFTD
ncbi:MAG: VOC family protein [Solobacterium sp.]|nr:VOC family protein [Solobacterium sp.]